MTASHSTPNRKTPKLAHVLTGEVALIDLDHYTEFSIHTKDIDEDRINNHSEIQQLLAGLCFLFIGLVGCTVGTWNRCQNYHGRR